MGMLDDAIREHLQLKKRSGASEEEVKRLESEAFGPVRRDPVAAEAEDPELGAAPAAPAAPPAEELADTAPPVVPPATSGDPFGPPPSAPPASPHGGSWLDEDPVDTRHESTAEFSAGDVADAAGQPPTDYVAPDDEAEDLLEETPDFLQETPEHDRLWFEQRPPRDFDFDE